MITRLEAVNAVTAANELLPGLNPSVIRLNLTGSDVVDPLSGKKIEQTFSFGSSREARETKVNLAMLHEVVENGGVGVWLSPPDRFYDRGKILIAIKDGSQIVEYDITGQTFSGKDFAEFMTSLSAFVSNGYYSLPDMEILEGIIPMPQVWQGIKNDQAEMKFNRDVEEALENAKGNFRTYFQAKSGVDITLACPSDSVSVINKLVSPDGRIKTFVEKCGICLEKIHDWMSPGDSCPHCGETYLGVCG